MQQLNHGFSPEYFIEETTGTVWNSKTNKILTGEKLALKLLDGSIRSTERSFLLELMKEDGAKVQSIEDFQKREDIKLFGQGNRYAVSTTGTVWGIVNGFAKELKQQENYPGGYWRVSLKLTDDTQRKYYLVHQLVAEHFIGIPKDGKKYIVHHRNYQHGKDQNYLENLEVLDIAEHARIHAAHYQQAKEQQE